MPTERSEQLLLHYRLVGRIFKGAIAGLVATLVMTGVIFGARRAGWLGRLPPKEITQRAEQQVGIDPASQTPEEFTASWIVSHFGYGAACGGLYGLMRPLLPLPGALAGALFGLGLWAVSYLKLMPAMNLYPPVQKDDPSRASTMVVAHVVYGGVLGVITGRR
ncbi:MAG TPA: DUF6789 family protein [Chloroflexota bacterium]|nr:DUF6789 family protein [Chloroflexota bacterium]